MVCHPCRAAGVREDEVYTRKMTGAGRSYKERQRERVSCPECGKDLARGSLAAHCQTQHGVTKGGPRQEGDREGRGDEPRTYRMAFLTKAGLRHCPFERCSGRAATRTAMRVHFWHHHVRDTVVIMEEGNLPHPRCPLCDMLVPYRSLNGSHKRTAHCKKGVERKRRCLAAEEERAATSRAFSAYGRTLDIFQIPGESAIGGG